MRVVSTVCRFRHYASGFTALEQPLDAHSGQTCRVLRALRRPEVDPEVGRMYRVRFADGFESDVFADELGPVEGDALKTEREETR